MAEKTGEHDILAPKHIQKTYDKVASTYDALWTKHVAEPNARITRELRLKKGERVADLACGTGLHTLEMAQLTAPSEVVGVDYSEGMLASAKERLTTDNGLPVTLVHAKAEDFIDSAAADHFDAVSMRFMLAYLDWAKVLPRVGRIVAPGGRVGILTSLSNALPQLWKVWDGLTGGALPLTAPVPDSNEQIAALLAEGGLRNVEGSWEYQIRLWFDDGMQALAWMKESGYGTHPALSLMTPEAVQQLMQVVAKGLEDEFRTEQGVPLEFTASGIIVRK